MSLWYPKNLGHLAWPIILAKYGYLHTIDYLFNFIMNMAMCITANLSQYLMHWIKYSCQVLDVKYPWFYPLGKKDNSLGEVNGLSQRCWVYWEGRFSWNLLCSRGRGKPLKVRKEGSPDSGKRLCLTSEIYQA